MNFKAYLALNGWQNLEENNGAEYNRQDTFRFHSHGLVIPDALIAATALDENLTLITSNIRHFDMIEGLGVQKTY